MKMQGSDRHIENSHTFTKLLIIYNRVDIEKHSQKEKRLHDRTQECLYL